MKTTLTLLALCLINVSFPAAYGLISDPTPNQQNAKLQIPQVCVPLLRQFIQLQQQYTIQNQYLVKLQQQQQVLLAKLSQVSPQGRSIKIPGEQNQVISSRIAEVSPQGKDIQLPANEKNSVVIEATESPVPEGIIPGLIAKTGNLAGGIANTAGQLAKDDIDLKAALLKGVLGGAGKAAANSFHQTGQVAAHALSNIEDGFKNIFSNFGK